jgi:hypothetical protein
MPGPKMPRRDFITQTFELAAAIGISGSQSAPAVSWPKHNINQTSTHASP